MNDIGLCDVHWYIISLEIGSIYIKINLKKKKKRNHIVLFVFTEEEVLSGFLKWQLCFLSYDDVLKKTLPTCLPLTK